MKKELGKWLMDIAKYLTTAVLLSSVFNDIKDSWIIYFVVSIAIVLTLLSGLWLVREEKRKENDMGAIIMSVLVSVIAIVGVIYFNHQDKKEALKIIIRIVCNTHWFELPEFIKLEKLLETYISSGFSFFVDGCIDSVKVKDLLK